TKTARKWREENGMKKMAWLPNPSDLNPIENIWWIIRRRLNKLPKKSTGKQEMMEMIKEIWDSITPEEIRALVTTMNSGIRKVLEVDGGSIDY
ncbi:hypothetical protein BC939DRAFT_398649, partial [Gamsiella multidivaricata]|uniref:uncharacterized protein n=1 Tax=Gamsiella multidivaricata TaxID=101098 RepID=UPI00221FE6FE